MKELRCPVCESRVRPNTRRPGFLPRSIKFDQTVGCDLFDFDEFGYKVIVLNMICWGTGYQQACRVPDKSSATVANAFAMHWHKHYKMPELIITDQGTEFTGKEFTSYVADHVCLHHFIDSQSSWQQGRTERDGGSLREDLRKIVQECGLMSESEFDMALAEAVAVRNSYPNTSGFSAHQRVFGSTLRLPGSLLSDDPTDRYLVATDPTTESLRSASIRDAAMKAYVHNSDVLAL